VETARRKHDSKVLSAPSSEGAYKTLIALPQVGFGDGSMKRRIQPAETLRSIILNRRELAEIPGMFSCHKRFSDLFRQYFLEENGDSRGWRLSTSKKVSPLYLLRLFAAASDRLVRPLRLRHSPLCLPRLSAAASDRVVRPLRASLSLLCLLRLSAAPSERVVRPSRWSPL
jgi:hypothetical protein